MHPHDSSVGITGEEKMRLVRGSSHSAGRLVLLDCGMNSARRIVKAGAKQPDERGQRVFEALKNFGLFNFMRTVVKWQKLDICSQFVLQWNPKAKKTYVNGIEIDANFETFVMVTGLLAEESAMASEDANQADRYQHLQPWTEKIWKETDEGNKYSFIKLDDNWFRDLIVLLARTIWMKYSSCKGLPGDLVELVSEGVSGKRLRWSKTIHRKFVCEVGRLHHALQSRQECKQSGSPASFKTLAGPVMCFLYIQAKLKVEALEEVSRPVQHAKEKARKEEYGSDEEKSLPPEDVSKSEVTDLDYSKQAQVSSAALTSPDFSVNRRKKRKLFDPDKVSVSLPACSSVTEDLAAKVLELECVIARQNAELAESRLRLYTKNRALR